MSDQKADSGAGKNPKQFKGLKIGPVKKTAAGIPAVLSGLRHVLSEAGLIRGWNALKKMNQKDGFVCPSCAWPDPDDDRNHSTEYCENGAKAIAEEATAKKLDADFFVNHSVNDLGAMSDYEIGRKGRIAQPMYLPTDGKYYQPISWDEAFQKIAVSLNALDSPDEAIFYTSGRTSNEAAFLYQLFVREYGTNNLPDCSNMCHESSGVALGETLGIGKGSVKLDDFYQAEVIVILGQNPGTNHPRMLTALEKAKKNGAIIISINPLPEAGLMGFNNPQELKGWIGSGTALTDIFLPIKINGDMALLQAIALQLLEQEQKDPGKVLDLDFIKNKTEGFDNYVQHLKKQNLHDLAEACGIDPEQIKEAASVLRDKKKIIACWAMGLTQHRNAVDTIKEIVNLLLLKGSIGKPGAGTCPVRGHSNVQGDRTMGINEKPSYQLLKAIADNFQFAPSDKPGYDVVESIKAMHHGKAKVFFAMGGNFLSATPDTHYTAEALKKCKLTVQVSTKLNRSHLVHGKEALILPCLGRSDRDIVNGVEQFVSCENSMSVVQSSKGVLHPISNSLLSEPVIVCRLAKATLKERSKVNWDKYLQHYDQIRDDIERTIPGFEKYNERIRIPGGFYLPNCNREGNFGTVTQKAHFTISRHTTVDLAENELMMMTIRSHDQFNTTIYGLNDRYRGIYHGRRVILMNQQDMTKRGLQKEDVVDIISNHDGIERIARKFIVVPYPIPPTCAATYFPETNVLVPITSVAEKSNTPVSKLVIVKIRKISSSANERQHSSK